MDRPLPQGRDDCPRCAALEEWVRELEARLAELEDRLRANSSNSSRAPSSDPAWAAKLKPKKPTGKKPGGQPGHTGHHRTLLPVEQVDQIVQYRPVRCRHCGTRLSAADARVHGRHQVAELPTRAVTVTEHQSCACRCRSCGQVTSEPIPAAIRARCTGERLSAAMCYLEAFVHGSRRAVEEVVGEMLGCPLSLGSVSNREREMADALATPYTQVQQRVRSATVKNVDETGWRRAGRWLWVAATPNVAAQCEASKPEASKPAALFHIDRGRSWHGLQNLLGEQVQGTVCSDRYGVYEYLKLCRRGVCWAHLKRDFQRWVDRGGATTWVGKEGLAITQSVFGLWRRFKGRQIIRSTLRRLLSLWRQKMADLLRRGTESGVSKVKHFCRNLKKVYAALWTFARVEGVEPTNNHAERMLRPAVIWRKTCFGSHSQGGCRYAERMLTVLQTLRLQGRSTLTYLTETLHAHRHALTPPTLV